jgi:manganese/zinc/iron transport system ATP- binding protein
MLASAVSSRVADSASRSPIAMHDVSVAYRGATALCSIDLTVPSGCLCAVMGPNGGGKTTLIKALLGLVPAAGEVRIFGESYASQRRRVGYVPQRDSVDWDFPMTALDIVMMGAYGQLGWFRRAGRRERDAARDCLAQVGMADCADRRIRALSGGQRQRVFLARALAQNASLYLLDEPFAGVDAPTERAVVTLLQALRASGCTIVCVHHDLTTAPDYFDWLILLNTRLIAAGPFAQTFTAAHVGAAYSGAAQRSGLGEPIHPAGNVAINVGRIGHG